jgi:CheY-like chemotaxis protein
MDNAAADRVLRVITLLCPERRLNRLLRLALESDGFCIDGLDGLEVCRRARGFSTVPIIMLTAGAAEHARVEVRRGYRVLALSPTEYRLRCSWRVRRHA